eukprot:12660-Eustigmatos_ZCMA.PRE.1
MALGEYNIVTEKFSLAPEVLSKLTQNVFDGVAGPVLVPSTCRDELEVRPGPAVSPSLSCCLDLCHMLQCAMRVNLDLRDRLSIPVVCPPVSSSSIACAS